MNSFVKSWQLTSKLESDHTWFTEALHAVVHAREAVATFLASHATYLVFFEAAIGVGYANPIQVPYWFALEAFTTDASIFQAVPLKLLFARFGQWCGLFRTFFRNLAHSSRMIMYVALQAVATPTTSTITRATYFTLHLAFWYLWAAHIGIAFKAFATLTSHTPQEATCITFLLACRHVYYFVGYLAHSSKVIIVFAFEAFAALSTNTI